MTPTILVPIAIVVGLLLIVNAIYWYKKELKKLKNENRDNQNVHSIGPRRGKQKTIN